MQMRLRQNGIVIALVNHIISSEATPPVNEMACCHDMRIQTTPSNRREIILVINALIREDCWNPPCIIVHRSSGYLYKATSSTYPQILAIFPSVILKCRYLNTYIKLKLIRANILAVLLDESVT